jgi:MraZ protein
VAFRGTFDYTLDVKNRLTIPSKFRAAFADGVVLALRHDGTPCVSVWRREEYDDYTAQVLADQPLLGPRRLELARFFFSNSHDAELDAAGRVIMPSHLHGQIGGTKDVVVAGVGECLEVWDRGAWSDHNGTLAQTVADITSQIGNVA